MFFLKVATYFLVALAVGAEKKIELQDIEEDNLRSEMRSENEKELDKSDSPEPSGAGTGPGYTSLDFLKSGLLRYFDNPAPAPQQQRYIHQYSVTEQPEKAPPTAVNSQANYAPPATQQAMVGYLSNIPMQIYLVPQHYSGQSQQSNLQNVNQQYQSHGVAKVASYQTAPEAGQTQNNYIEVPAYMQSAGKTYVQHFSPPQVTYVTFPGQPTAPSPQATAAPVVAYQVPVIQYNPASAPSAPAKAYYHTSDYIDTNSVDEIANFDDQKQYSTQTEVSNHAPTAPEFPRHYNSRTPIREDYRHHAIPELPRPDPLILKAQPPHLAHLPKTFPKYRPLTSPVYQGYNSFTHRPHEHYGPPSFKRRPTSLLDSYIPSSLQLEYLKRGLVKEPLAAYDALSSGRLPYPIPRHYERGFLPNQMYHTGGGGVTYGHYKRTPKLEHKHDHKVSQK